ncbi:MAG: quinone-dependent dihydroorotate dehydrogenase, partial [Chloroflexi bacterium]|nr:quinone-dependent dihydroorotate dehydrogenase [Chloroflexota bacterium]
THERLLALLEALLAHPAVFPSLLAPFRYRHPALATSAFGLRFANPLGLGAGFDKDGRAIPAWPYLGFGFCEVGTVTAMPQLGNPRPRLFRLPKDQALINRFGFNNAGAEATRERLAGLQERGLLGAVPLGINIGKSAATPLESATADYLRPLELLYPFAAYFVVNVSSPNTPGLRDLQQPQRLAELLLRLQERNRALASPDASPKPLLLKVAPDLTLAELDDLLRVALDAKVAGIIATNTTVSREGLSRPTTEPGGLSGLPLRPRSTDFVRHIYLRTEGKLPIIGVGGIFSADDAYAKIRAGASLIQIYTALVYEGPFVVRRILHGLVRLLHADGFTRIGEAVGTDAHRS